MSFSLILRHLDFKAEDIRELLKDFWWKRNNISYVLKDLTRVFVEELDRSKISY